jgi:hypothetical protein
VLSTGFDDSGRYIVDSDGAEAFAVAAASMRALDRACDLFDLRVRFDRTRPPWRIWLLRAALDRDIAEPERTGEIRLVFRDLTPGLAYGARWDAT